jgi:hypothetical protein
MLKRRPSQPFWVVMSHDGALDAIDSRLLEEYYRTRDISILPIDLKTKTVKSTGEPVGIFLCKPLTVMGERFVDDNGEGFAKSFVLGSHVIDVHNVEGASIRQTKEGPELTPESLGDDGIDGATRDELYRVIIEKGRGADGSERGFTSPDGWRVQRMRRALMPAGIARLDRIAEVEKAAIAAPPASGTIPESTESPSLTP